MSRYAIMVRIAICTLGLALTQGQVEAQVKPFSIVGWGAGPTGLPLPCEAPRAHWAVGAATYLGGYFGQGEVETDSATFNADGTITGEFGSAVPFAFTSEDGDVLACYYGRTGFGASQPGTFTLVPVSGKPGWYVAYWIAEFIPYAPDCTGKFAGVTGGWTMYANWRHSSSVPQIPSTTGGRAGLAGFQPLPLRRLMTS